jgi:flotillin
MIHHLALVPTSPDSPFQQLRDAPDVLWIVAGAFLGLIGLVMLIQVIKSFLHLCPPNQVLIFSGRKQRMADGSVRGYRTIFGGRGFRMPFIEKAHYMNLSVMEVPISTRGAYSQGGIPLNVDAIANVKISSDSIVVTNAIERFLGRDPNEIRRVAKETLEGHLRGVLARLTPEEVNEDRLKFADELSRESELDLSKLGLHLDTLKIQHVGDDQQYLDSIGREAIANVVRDAEIAESDMKREAELTEAEAQARGNVKQAEVEAAISQMRNELRKIQADLESQVKSEEEITLAAAREARAKAEQELQGIRAELEAIRLQSDAVIPAEARQTAQQFKARGDAAVVRERGAAVAQSVDLMHSAWSNAGQNALAVYLIDEIEEILRAATKGVERMNVEAVNVIDSGRGQVLASFASNYPALLKLVFDSVAHTTGIDIPKVIAGSATFSESKEKEAVQ